MQTKKKAIFFMYFLNIREAYDEEVWMMAIITAE